MAACMQLNIRPFRHSLQSKPISRFLSSSPKCVTIRSSTTWSSKRYNITLLPGDGIGPEVISVAKDVLKLAGSNEASSKSTPISFTHSFSVKLNNKNLFSGSSRLWLQFEGINFSNFWNLHHHHDFFLLRMKLQGISIVIFWNGSSKISCSCPSLYPRCLKES